MSNRLGWEWTPPLVMLGLLTLIWLTGSNVALFFWINDWGRVTGPALWSNLTVFGDGFLLLPLALPLLWYRPRWVWAMLLAALVTTAAVRGLKASLVFDRPPAVLDPGQINVIGETLTSRTFPSGHAAGALTMASVLILGIRSSGLRVLLLVFASLVALSRVVVGVHWPIDILAGATIGWLSGATCYRFSFYWHWAKNRRAWFGLLALVAAGTCALPFQDLGYPLAKPLQIVLACLALLGTGVLIWCRSGYRECND